MSIPMNFVHQKIAVFDEQSVLLGSLNALSSTGQPLKPLRTVLSHHKTAGCCPAASPFRSGNGVCSRKVRAHAPHPIERSTPCSA